MYKRLHSCIQAAASQVKDFTAERCIKRVEILVNLIPKEYADELSKCQVASEGRESFVKLSVQLLAAFFVCCTSK